MATGARYFSLAAAPLSPRALLRLAIMLRRERVDILQTHLFHASLMGRVAARLAGTRTVLLTRHHTSAVRIEGTSLHVAADGWAARNASGVIGLSRYVCRYVVEVEQVPQERVHFVPQGFDFRRLEPRADGRKRVRADCDLADAFVIGCVARLFPTKGHSFLLRAFADLLDHIPHARLLLVGGGDAQPIVSLANSLGISEKIVFAGFRSDVPDCLAAMDVVVHPSETEAFCQAIVEAMAAGRPVVATDVAAAGETIDDGATGILVPPRDPQAIVRAVLALYHAPGRRDSMGAAGRTSVRDRFTIEKMIDAQIALYAAARATSTIAER